MIKIPKDFIEQNFSPADFLANCDEAFRWYGQGVATMPPREQNVDASGRFTLRMPAAIPGYTGYKFIEELPATELGKLGQRTAVIRLKPESSDPSTSLGAREAEMDAEHITNMRTGAAGALGLKYFAPQAKIVSILGTGKISKALALCAIEIGVRTLNVYSRNPENREKFKQELSGADAEIVLFDSLAGCVAGSEAILTAVPTPQPILYYQDLPRPIYISVMGGDSRTAQLDPEILTRAVVVTDNQEQAQKSGEFKTALAEGYYDKINFAKHGDRAANIGDAANGQLKLSGDIVIGYFTGLAVQDINAAKMVYKKFVAEHN
ncbi:MAG: NAD(P)-binding domain-containing protein [Minisyncoccia bacterium]